jgi:hypothetical protein
MRRKKVTAARGGLFCCVTGKPHLCALAPGRRSIKKENCMSLVAVGTVAFDDIETPFGRAEKVIGGACTYIALAASYFTTRADRIGRWRRFSGGNARVAEKPWRGPRRPAACARRKVVLLGRQILPRPEYGATRWIPNSTCWPISIPCCRQPTEKPIL